MLPDNCRDDCRSVGHLAADSVRLRPVRLLTIALVVMLIGHGPRGPSCVVVAPLVLLYGKDAAIAWAKAKGYTDAQIEDVQKRCGKYMRR